MTSNLNPDKYEKDGVYINYLAGYQNSIEFVEVFIFY
jgi:hypothetical protein